MGAAPASAATPTGGCWVYGFNTGDPIESTTPAYDISSGPAAWTDDTKAPVGPADYTITTSGGTTVGSTRNFSLTFNKTPKSAAPASGTAYFYFSVNGTSMAAPLTNPFNIPAGQVQAGTTLNGTFPITSSGTNIVRFDKVIYDATAQGVRVGCNGQTGAVSGGVNPATTPVPTSITSSFNVVGPTATVSSISNQTVTTHARRLDVISFSVSNFAGAGTGTASLCNSAGADCDAGTSSVTIDGTGSGTGTLAVGGTPATGSRTLKIVSGGDTSLTPITIMTAPTISITPASGGANTQVQITGTDWDPNQVVTLGGYKPNPAYPCSPIPCGPFVATADASTTATANASGNITPTSFTVNDPTTVQVGGSRTHAAGPPPVVIFGAAAFAFSGDSCTAKVGLATTGSCSLVETVTLAVTAGNLTMSKDPGSVTLSGVTLGGAAQTSTGSLRDVTVKDYRGGTLGWDLVGTFSGLTAGSASIPTTALNWTPSCLAAGNSDDTVTAGAPGAFANSTTSLPLCKVTGPAGLGADGISGGDATADAGLSLTVPAVQAAGNYTGTITLTLS
ncbi:MAG TPA: hypothetical protein VD764_06450 [Nocardioides sp.]|nr:hypothetical protein [Nocardioides sp.]